MSLTPPAIPDARAALAALAELEGAASLLRQVLTCEPQASPDVLARLAGLLQDTAKDLTVWATWLELPDEETPPGAPPPPPYHGPMPPGIPSAAAPASPPAVSTATPNARPGASAAPGSPTPGWCARPPAAGAGPASSV